MKKYFLILAYLLVVSVFAKGQKKVDLNDLILEKPKNIKTKEGYKKKENFLVPEIKKETKNKKKAKNKDSLKIIDTDSFEFNISIHSHEEEKEKIFKEK